ncbi:MAG: cardiolipin synthase [Tyzzerella sp.]|uniref:Cardiolipin synthase n=1 Tax=Candidatus Fimicola merdigallinarum TaxID=2840819 RepID=A0A9D9DX51_9FIRM|nr:cardiolipin synthase [Candidatus Fimicola merdigallinarum]
MSEIFNTIYGGVGMIFTLNVILAIFMLFSERRKPASTWAWLLVLFFIPIFGFLIYLIFGRDSKREKLFSDKDKFDTEVYFDYLLKSDRYMDKVKWQQKAMENKLDVLNQRYLDSLLYLNINTGNWYTSNNEIERFTDGTAKFEALIKDIRRAKKFIHMEYYIIRNDGLGKRIVSELSKKAKEGVEVRLLYDGMGCSRLPKDFFSELTENGGRAVPFLPRLMVRINYRNHRKICVIDGKVGYIGGFNIGDEYLGIVKRYGRWRDTHIRVCGDAVDQLQIRFIMDWNFIAEDFKVELDKKYFPPKKDFDGVKMQIVSSGPDTEWKNIRNAYLKMINDAKDHVYISTPYFVPDDSILNALKVSALSGVDVRIIFPGNPDHPFVYWASMSYLGELLYAGVKCYQYQNGFTHTKYISIDGNVSSVGTANMDIRSFAVNFETNAFIFDEGVTKLLEKDFDNDLKSCFEITTAWYEKRKLMFRFKEAISRLISPIL